VGGYSTVTILAVRRAYADECITEIMYQQSGPDITGELERFITAARQL
jgi:hypothetical protein